MSNYSAASAAGQIFPIVGMGIGLGLIAHTARGVTDTMYGPRYGRRPRARTARSMSYRPRSGFGKPSQLSYKQPKLSIKANLTFCILRMEIHLNVFVNTKTKFKSNMTAI